VTLSIGVDVGGTKIEVCLFDTDTEVILDTRRTPTAAALGGEVVLDRCRALVDELLSDHGLDAANVPLGLCICEHVDLDGRIVSSETVDWSAVDPQAAWAAHSVVAVESDVRAGGLCEARLGAARGAGHCVYVSVGTGISFALMIDGVPYRGARGNALILGAPPVERVASGAAMAAVDARASTDPPGVVRRAAGALGAALAWLVNALDPQLIVLGGGLGVQPDYRSLALETMRPLIALDCSRDVVVAEPRYGASSAAVGAAISAADRLDVRDESEVR
jgi:glucokinase